MIIDMNKQYRTRDGRPVRILCVDRKGDYPVCGLVSNADRADDLMCWALDGTFSRGSCGNDLIEVKPRIKRTVFLNMYQKEEEPCAHLSRETADRDAHHARIACIKVELDFEEGEGL